MKLLINPLKLNWKEILQRPHHDNVELRQTMRDILEDVKLNGDSAIRKYSLKFHDLVIRDIIVSETEINEAEDLVPADLKNAITLATKNIWKFHEAQVEAPKEIETMPGVTCWRKSIAIEKVGLYIPGGSAPLFSTLLMLGIPATIAGCKEIIVCTPPGKNQKVAPSILYVCKLLGITRIFKAGGGQAIGAMAYGTETIPPVNKIFGPGNQFVTCAKQLVNTDGVAIDMPAGPSEVAVYADESSEASFVAADLLSQAEHGADSHVLLVASSEGVAEAIKQRVYEQLEKLARRDIAQQSLDNSHIIVMENTDEAFDLLNTYAAEHLIIATDNADELSSKVINAGSVFIGHYSPESAGDYASGTNHTLPTNGYAASYSGVSLDSFIKKVTFQKLSRGGLEGIGDAVETMALAEGLDAHKMAISVRRTKIIEQ